MKYTHNPLFPERKIRHASKLIAMGFEIEMGWYKSQTDRPCNVSKLIYWKHPVYDIRITLFDYKQISWQTLMGLILSNHKYQLKKQAKVVFE